MRRRQAESVTTARNSHEPWTPHDDLIALNYPIAEAARRLGRTHAAVTQRRQKLRSRG